MLEIVLSGVISRFENDTTSLSIGVLLVLFYFFVYKRDKYEIKYRHNLIDIKLDKYIKDTDIKIKNTADEQMEIFKDIRSSIESLSDNINSIHVILAKNYITKADLYDEDWKEITIRMEES